MLTDEFISSGKVTETRKSNLTVALVTLGKSNDLTGTSLAKPCSHGNILQS